MRVLCDFSDIWGQCKNDEKNEVASRYDGNNYLLLMTETYSDGTIHTSGNQYDDFDRLAVATHPYHRSLNYGYDLNSNRTRLTDPDGISTLYTFDALNRVASVQNQQGTTR